VAKRPRDNPTDRAVRAALAMPVRSGWITGVHFDEAKRERLAAILDGIAKPASAAELIQQAEWAVIELAMDDEQKRVAAARDLADLANAAVNVTRAWGKVVGIGYGPLRAALRADIPGADITIREDRVAQLERVMGEDLLRLAKAIERMLAVTKERGKVRRPPEYLCATKIALAWRASTGKPATLTRNFEAVSGPQATAFQRFVVEAAPSIGERTWRHVVEALGTKSR
jgi:hypothetical protein